MTDMSMNQPGWYPDPTGRFEHRYHDGASWTDNVATAGVSSIDAFQKASQPPTPPVVPNYPASGPSNPDQNPTQIAGSGSIAGSAGNAIPQTQGPQAMTSQNPMSTPSTQFAENMQNNASQFAAQFASTIQKFDIKEVLAKPKLIHVTFFSSLVLAICPFLTWAEFKYQFSVFSSFSRTRSFSGFNIGFLSGWGLFLLSLIILGYVTTRLIGMGPVSNGRGLQAVLGVSGLAFIFVLSRFITPGAESSDVDWGNGLSRGPGLWLALVVAVVTFGSLLMQLLQSRKVAASPLTSSANYQFQPPASPQQFQGTQWAPPQTPSNTPHNTVAQNLQAPQNPHVPQNGWSSNQSHQDPNSQNPNS